MAAITSGQPTTLAAALIELAEAQDTLRAISAGEVDAFVITNRGADRSVLTLSSADGPYQRFVENMRDGAATITTSGLVLYANSRLGELLACGRDAIIGVPLATFLVRSEPLSPLELGGPDGRGATFEIDLIDDAGAHVPVLVGSSPLKVDDDRLICLTFTDLTAQKTQEQEIARLTQAQVADGLRFTAMVEALQEGVLVQDREGRVLEANRMASTILGVPHDLLVTTPPSLLPWRGATIANKPIAPDQTPGRSALSCDESRLGVVVGFERGDGQVWLEINAVPLRFPPETEDPLVISSFRDITARMEAQERERALSAIVESSSDAIIGMTVDRTITSWNAGATALFGYDADEAVGRSISMLDSSPEQQRIRAEWDVLNIPLHSVQMACRTKAGRVVQVSKSDSLIVDEHGELVGRSGICRDITVQIELEQLAEENRRELELARHATEIEGLAHEEADRANRAKSEFLSRMSHELRTPLNAVLGFGQILLMDDLTPDQRENVGFIRSAGEHLLALINDVLDISTIEAGALRLSLEAVHLEDVLEEAVSLIRPQAAQQGIDLPADIAGCHTFVHADRQRLLQVLLNLLSNGLKYNRPGGRIDICCESSGGTVSIAVSDTGIGISDADLSKLFTPFERLGAERSDIEGSGVGLALSRVLSQQMGGALTVFSAVGAGSTFTLELPAGLAPQQPGIEAAVEEPAHARMATGALSVLAIEDNVANIRLLERAMERFPDVTLLTAIQGRLGLELAGQHQPDLIVLDLHLPDIDGGTVFRHLQAEPSTSSIPVVICSADASPGQRRAFLDRGAVAYLTKPIDLTELFALVERLRTGEDIVHPLDPEQTP